MPGRGSGQGPRGSGAGMRPPMGRGDYGKSSTILQPQTRIIYFTSMLFILLTKPSREKDETRVDNPIVQRALFIRRFRGPRSVSSRDLLLLS